MLFQVDAMAVTGPGLCARVWKTVSEQRHSRTDRVPSVCPTTGRYLCRTAACRHGHCRPAPPRRRRLWHPPVLVLPGAGQVPQTRLPPMPAHGLPAGKRATGVCEVAVEVQAAGPGRRGGGRAHAVQHAHGAARRVGTHQVSGACQQPQCFAW